MIIWTENGNLECLCLPKKKTLTFDFQGSLTQIWVDELGIYAKDKQEQVYFVKGELLLSIEKSGNLKQRAFEDKAFKVLWKPLFK